MKHFGKSIACFVVFIVFLAGTLYAEDADELNAAFCLAAGFGQLDRVQDLHEKGADINFSSPGTEGVPPGQTALMLATARNHIDVVKYLLKNGAQVNHADDWGGTALIYSVWKGNEDIVRLLLAKKANISAKTKDGRTAMSVAKHFGHNKIVKMLKASESSAEN